MQARQKQQLIVDLFVSSLKNQHQAKIGMSSPAEPSFLDEPDLFDPKLLESALAPQKKRCAGGPATIAEDLFGSKIVQHAKKCHRRKISRQYLPRHVSPESNH